MSIFKTRSIKRLLCNILALMLIVGTSFIGFLPVYAVNPTVTTDLNNVRQKIDGFGLVDNGWAGMSIADGQLIGSRYGALYDHQGILDLLFSPTNGIGISILKTEVMPSVEPNEGVWDWDPNKGLRYGVTIGHTPDDVGTVSGANCSTYILACPYTQSKTGTVESMTVYVKANPGNGTMRMGIYSDNANKPGTKLAQTDIFTPTVGWNSKYVINPNTQTLTGGTKYWLVWEVSNDTLDVALTNDFTVTSGQYAPWTYDATGLPTTFPTGSGYSTWSGDASIYAVVITSTTTLTLGHEVWLMDQAKARGCNIFLAGPWSPPGWMKTSGFFYHNGGLRSDKRSAYATYLSTYIKEMKARFNEDMGYISLVNEPDAIGDFDDPADGLSSWTSADFKAVAPVVKQQFNTDGVTAKIMLPEESTWTESRAADILNDPNTSNAVDIVNAHGYDFVGNFVASGDETHGYSYFTNAKSKGKGVWETEVSDFYSAGINIGNQTILPTSGTGSSSYLYAHPSNLWTMSKINSISIYVAANPNSGNLRLGIYDDNAGKPGTLQAWTNEFIPTAGAWNTQNVTTPKNLPRGTYWLAWQPSNDTLDVRKTNTGPKTSGYSYPRTYGPLPTTFPATPYSTYTGDASIYAILNTVNDPSIDDGVKWAKYIYNCMTVSQVNAWFHFYTADELDVGDALVTLTGTNPGDYTVNKRCYTIGNYSKFIRPGYYRVGVTNPTPASGVYVSSYKDDASGKYVTVAVNQNTSGSNSIDFKINGSLAGSTVTPYRTSSTENLAQLTDISVTNGTFTATLPANSVTTFVGTYTPGLIGYWKFDEGSGSSAADSSNNGNTGTLTGSPTWVTGHSGSALQFNGSNYAQVSNSSSLQITGDITIAAWVNRNTAGNYDVIAAKSDGTTYNYNFFFDSLYPDKESLYSASTSPTQAISTSTVSAGSWQKVAVTRSGNTVTFYLNGSAVGTATITGSFGSSTVPLKIGHDGYKGMSGSIDELRIYNRALTQAEIQALP